jgi:translation initiation factor eIF-2B subunit delta
MLEPAEGFEVANPGYDATPTRLLDSVVTENAVIEF